MEELLIKAARAGVRLELKGNDLRVTAPGGALTDELRQALRLHKEKIVAFLQARRANAEELIAELTHDSVNSSEPFPLTDLQHAYWVGRDSAWEIGNIASHVYMEFDCKDLDLARLNEALRRLIERQHVLRLVVDRSGMQRILPSVPQYQIATEDCSKTSFDEAERTINAVRQILSHQILNAEQWPLFDIRATLLPDSRLRLHVSFDLLVVDGTSLFLFFREWSQLYQRPDSNLPELGISFRDYVLAERALHESASYRKAHAYWMGRVGNLPAAPELPMRSDLAARQSPHFNRREGRLEKGRWQKLKSQGAAEGLTPSTILLALYSEVLARWSTHPHFTLNVTLSNRRPLHKDINNLLGEFTSPTMQEIDRRDMSLSFADFARQLQQQLFNDLEYRQVSGVAVLREWVKHRDMSLQAAMPVVFSSGLSWNDEDDGGDLEQFGERVYMISQTSQVWLDHHVMELKGDLVFNWDAVDAMFEDGVLDAMFAAYRDLIERLADDDSLWSSKRLVALPEKMQHHRIAANQTAHTAPERPIHAGFVAQALTHPQAVAIIAAGRTMTYGELLAESVAVADWLIGRNVGAGQPVAILMNKGWEQVVAVFGVLLAGAAYVPIDADLPTKRQLELLRISEIAHVLIQRGAARDVRAIDEWVVHEIRAGERGDFGPIHEQSLAANLDRLAYVIFTSGTTGVPKGVMIDHRGAANTITHINRLFDVGPKDRILAASSLSFDLSVYDIFGLLEVGGTIVLPDYRRGHDPLYWRDLLVKHQISLWNSAPQLMQMLMDSFHGVSNEAAPLRTVLLSGDFIPLDLPNRIRRRYQSAEVISLGGATEASIWSIYYPVKAVEPSWSSIPYGVPLPNQTIWVYDQLFRPCPDHVKGRIFIGGIGLALGYWRDAEKTALRFITHPETGERLYDTGDLGKYAPDGNVFILGRDDGQIKIRGHRVELGEIEVVLRQHPQIKQAVVLPTPGPLENRQLAAYIELVVEDGEDGESRPISGLDSNAVKNYLEERLPSYMSPQIIITMDHIPVSTNGKVDYQALSGVLKDVATNKSERVAPRNETERIILDAWRRIIVGYEIGVNENFFEVGGDSVLATQLLRELNVALPFELEMHELFENLTVESLAVLFQNRSDTRQSEFDAKSDDGLPTSAIVSADREVLLEDIRAAAECFDGLNFSRNQRSTVSEPRAILITGGTGWIGSHVVAALLSHTAATLHCLVRATDKAKGHIRLVDSMRRYGIEIDPSWNERIEPVCGDLSLPKLGLRSTDWEALSETIDSIYHLGASVNVLHDYSTHRNVNVSPLIPIVQLAVEHHIKPIFFSSPMAVCRRHLDGRLVVFSEENFHVDPEGLMTGYSQSKWVAEQVLFAAMSRGLPAKVYRTSHALPSRRNGLAKPNDTYGAVLKVACEVGVVPDWSDSRLCGVPVDVFTDWLVENSLVADGYNGVIHVENRTPLSMKDVLEALLEANLKGKGEASVVSLDEWKTRCLEVAYRMPDDGAGLAQMLFANRAAGAAVENMFSNHPVEMRYLENSGQAMRLTDLTQPAYWRMTQGFVR
jgi:pyochelin synthetase